MRKSPPVVDDLTGLKFGRLTVIGVSSNSKGYRRWHCKCECGGESLVDGWRLKSGRSRSCGCRVSPVTSERNRTRVRDRVGETIGQLKVLRRSDRDDDVFWLCACACGREKEISSSELGKGKIRSCGCMWHRSSLKHTLYGVPISLKELAAILNVNVSSIRRDLRKGLTTEQILNKRWAAQSGINRRAP